MSWVANAEMFVGSRTLRNLLNHEYMEDTELFLESLGAADDAIRMLMDMVATMSGYAQALNLDQALTVLGSRS